MINRFQLKNTIQVKISEGYKVEKQIGPDFHRTRYIKVMAG